MTEENTDNITEVEQEPVFKLENSEFELSLKIDGFSNDKDKFKFIKSCEKMVRSSQEYRLWVEYIVDVLGQDTCEFTSESIKECSIEVHHHPICLYTIVQTVIDDFIQNKERFSSFDVAAKVIELHFQNKVGYVTMLSNLHEKYHNGFLQIPIEFVRGDYKYILTNYQIAEEEYKRILCLCAVHKDDVRVSWSRNNYPGVTSEDDGTKQITLDEQIEASITQADEPDISSMIKSLE